MVSKAVIITTGMFYSIIRLGTLVLLNSYILGNLKTVLNPKTKTQILNVIQSSNVVAAFVFYFLGFSPLLSPSDLASNTLPVLRWLQSMGEQRSYP